MMRARVQWSGTPVTGPGLSTFYWNDATYAGKPAALSALFTVLKNYVPTGVTWTIPAVADVVNVETGELEGSVVDGSNLTVLSSGGAVDFKPGVGGRILWATTGIVRGRKVQGKTYVVPLTSQEYPNGTVQGGTVSAINTALATYIGIGNPVVYSRPRPAPGGVGPDAPGLVHDILSGSFATKETWLRSRRT